MSAPEELLRQKLVDFQRALATQKKERAEQADAAARRADALLLQLVELADTLGTIERNAQEQSEEPAETAARLLRNLASVKGKILRALKKEGVERIEFPDNKAVMELSKILDTQAAPGREDASILEVVKEGYLDKASGKVLRKAELITVLNQS